MDNTGRINSKAIICLILGSITVVLPILGIVTGIMGIIYYSKAKKDMQLTGESGEGISVTGLVLSIVGLVLQLVQIIFLLFIFGAIFIDMMTYY